MSNFGDLLRAWRRQRGETQLSLSLRAGISTRHLSFIETGRSNPSREMVLLVGEALDLPLRERNHLLEAAGFASHYRERDLAAPELGQVRRTLVFLLERFEPYPALAVNGRYDVLLRNDSALRTFAPFVASTSGFGDPPNLLRVVADGFGDALLESGRVLDAMAQRAERVTGTPAAALHEELGIEGVSLSPAPSPAEAAELFLPLQLKNGSDELRLLSTFTTVGGAQDVTLEELQIECFLPADDASDRLIRELNQGESK